MEKNRIYNAAAGTLILVLSCFNFAFCQEVKPDSIKIPVPILIDSTKTLTPVDSSSHLSDSLKSIIKPDSLKLAKGINPLSMDTLKIDTTAEILSTYQKRIYLSQGIADETKGIPGSFLISPGPVGSPRILDEYLNVPGNDIYINGMPFLYNGINRPFVIGIDMETIPWETINNIERNSDISNCDGIDFRMGRPANNDNKSDVELARGPYGYNGSRWRFFRPFGQKAYGYFTLGFKKSGGYFDNSDYNGYHVSGGITANILNGTFSADLWKHRAKAGLNSFEYLIPQVSRQSRGIDRGEFKFVRKLKTSALMNISTVFQRNAQTIYGYANPLTANLNLSGGIFSVVDSLKGKTLEAGIKYYNMHMTGAVRNSPQVNDYDFYSRLNWLFEKWRYDIKLDYAWNKIDKSTLLPYGIVKYDLSTNLTPYFSVARYRRLPDMNLLYLNDTVENLGISGHLESYKLISNPDLHSPQTTKAAIGLQSKFGKFSTNIGVSYKTIDSQIYLNYSDSSGNFVARPTNFNDRFIELIVSAEGSVGPFSGEISGTVRRWNDKYFADGLEKDPAAIGFGRISVLKQFFIPKLYLGGSFEARVMTRRDYRSLIDGHADAFVATSGRLEFRYLDFTFWLNEENILNSAYTTLWPYNEAARLVWWGFRWDFID